MGAFLSKSLPLYTMFGMLGMNISRKACQAYAHCALQLMFHQNEESIKTKIIYIVNSVIRMDSDKQIKNDGTNSD